MCGPEEATFWPIQQHGQSEDTIALKDNMYKYVQTPKLIDSGIVQPRFRVRGAGARLIFSSLDYQRLGDTVNPSAELASNGSKTNPATCTDDASFIPIVACTFLRSCEVTEDGRGRAKTTHHWATMGDYNPEGPRRSSPTIKGIYAGYGIMALDITDYHGLISANDSRLLLVARPEVCGSPDQIQAKLRLARRRPMQTMTGGKKDGGDERVWYMGRPQGGIEVRKGGEEKSGKKSFTGLLRGPDEGTDDGCTGLCGCEYPKSRERSGCDYSKG
ncbi:hypothetical protein BGW80DRAFT_1450189 [Lactifluus volemus]|nr:hypothetical protein BGW80DRAFT_1450189 [Lactifluus volemus]